MSGQYDGNRNRGTSYGNIDTPDSSNNTERSLYDKVTNNTIVLIILAFNPINVEVIDAVIYFKRIILGPNRLTNVKNFIINLVWFIDELIAAVGTGGAGFFIPSADKEVVRLGKKFLPKSIVKQVGRIYDKVPSWMKESVEHEAKEMAKEEGKRLMTDGGQNINGANSRTSSGGRSTGRQWSDIRTDDRGSLNMNKLPISGSTIGKLAGGTVIILLVFILGTALLGTGGGVFGALADRAGANIDGPDFGEVGYMADSAFKTVSCFGDLGCYREWQLNNTRRPGSEDVGETYKLNIKNFQVYGTGNGVDVAYSSPNDAIPIYFLVQNARNGLKGIDARNVKYRVRVRDEKLLSTQDYCKTEWLELETNYGEDSGENVLIPGAAAEPLQWQDQLTLRECGLLKPGPGNYVNFVLEIKYDYSSKSTLYVKSMSQEHRRSQQIPIDFKRSETADTPVETFIETRSPILFAGSGDDRTPIPFTTRVGVHTDSKDVDYSIETSAFKFQDSSITEEVQDSCQGLAKSSDDENTYSLSEEMITRIDERQNPDENGPGQWFNYQSQPPPASCTMKLSDNAEGVSRTGETLTMSADVNYTVKLEEKEESFKIFNSRCATSNCPMLVPLKGEDINSDVINTDLNEANPSYTTNPNYWIKKNAYCSGNQDAQDGCSVLEDYKLENRGSVITDSQGRPVTIEDGDIAVDLSTIGNSPVNNLIKCSSSNPEQVVSVSMNDLKEAINSPNKALAKNGDAWEAERRDGCITNNNNQDSSGSSDVNYCSSYEHVSYHSANSGQEASAAAGCVCDTGWTRSTGGWTCRP